jgi:peptidoglycan-associated lipoprotein
MINRFFSVLLMALFMLSLTACRFGPVKEGGPGAQAEGEQAGQEGEQRYSADLGKGASFEELNDPNSPLSKRVLYFDLDSSQISDEQRNIIAAHARFLNQHPDVSVVLEGHADERGTREYNLALGERRAKAVQRLLEVQGVSPKQIQVISFGEERPVALEHDETAWRLNRRVEILYSG